MVNQDREFAIQQLVEIAVRALSAGVNDPFTAITCVDRIGSVLYRLVQRELPSPYRWDSHRWLRVVAPPTSVPSLIDAGLSQIRRCARDDASVSLRLMETVVLIAQVACRAEDRAALWRQAEILERQTRKTLPEDDRRVVAEQYHIGRIDVGFAPQWHSGHAHGNGHLCAAENHPYAC